MKLDDFTARCLRLLRDQGGPSKARHLLPMGYSEDQSISIRQTWSHCCAVGWCQKGWRGYEITTRGREALAEYDARQAKPEAARG